MGTWGATRSWLVGAVLLVAGGLPVTAAAQQAWVKGEQKFNLRTGPGTNYRIVGTVNKDDRVQITARESGWTQVRNRDGDQGWLPSRYLQQSLPNAMRLERTASELETVRKEFEDVSSETEKLQQENQRLLEQESAQAAESRALTEENLDLKAGERWPYLITGATILLAGMLGGALLAKFAGRRPQPRIRF